MSNNEILFKIDRQISTGLKIDATVEWPVRLDNSILLRLYIHGETVEAENGNTAIRILRYEFRVAKDSASPQNREEEGAPDELAKRL
jgi:hypothetical protein